MTLKYPDSYRDRVTETVVMLNLFQHRTREGFKQAAKKNMQLSYVYIMTNTYRTTLYIGVTSDLYKRVMEHQEGIGSKFTGKYDLKDLIYYEEFTDIEQAISREKQLKNWRKDWKLNLIKEQNPKMETLRL